MKNKLGLYLHIPYCKSKCAYCDFYSLRGREDYERYANALVLHMEDYSEALEGRELDSIYIGGGTPTVLPDDVFCDIVKGIKDNFVVSGDAEFSVECNPATAGISDFRKYLKCGVNRLSIGAQSACDRELKGLTRTHTWEDAAECFRLARKAGFRNINTDLMYGIPLQTKQSLLNTLGKVCRLEPEHISLYGLKIEEDTPYERVKDKLELPDEDTEADMYFSALEFLAGHGYAQYEISNFAKEGYACRHNIRYWSCGEYLGLGPGAHSYLGGTRFSFKRDIERYMEAMEHPGKDYDITDEHYSVSASDRIGEYVMLHLRTAYGIDRKEFSSLFGLEFERMYGESSQRFLEGGYMEKDENRIYLNPRGMYISNYILSDMLDFDGGIATGEADGINQ